MGWCVACSVLMKPNDRPGSAPAVCIPDEILISPSNFDPARKYPVIENIYAGP
jgi:hypothetical protein